MTTPLSAPGPRPYGETTTERRVQRRIRSLRRARWTWQAIADAFNAEGQLQRNQRPWTAQRVAGVHARFVADAAPQ